MAASCLMASRRALGGLRVRRTDLAATCGRGAQRQQPAGSALGFDDDRDFGREALVDLDRDLVGAQRLQRLLEVVLVTVDLDPSASERVGDVLRRDRAVELAALADLDAHRQRRRPDSRRGDLGVLTLALA